MAIESLGMRLICLSDTHQQHARLTLPPADVLIHAGDFCGACHAAEAGRFCTWLAAQPVAHKIVVAGNHDRCLDPAWSGGACPSLVAGQLAEAGAVYLQDSSIEIGGFGFWGTPWTPEFCAWSFMAREAELAVHFAQIPDGIDVLISHGPAFGILDGAAAGRGRYHSVGSRSLLHRIEQVRPALHVCGHIHEGHGSLRQSATLHVNASAVDEHYKSVHAAVVVDLHRLADGTVSARVVFPPD